MKVKLVIKKTEENEFAVRYIENGRFSESKTAYESDLPSAVDTAAATAARLVRDGWEVTVKNRYSPVKVDIDNRVSNLLESIAQRTDAFLTIGSFHYVLRVSSGESAASVNELLHENGFSYRVHEVPEDAVHYFTVEQYSV